MKRIVLILIAIVVSFIAAPSALAQAPTPSPAPNATATNSACESWFLSPIACILEPLVKAKGGALNKQAGDVGTSTFAMAQFIIAGMGACDSECNPYCPKSLSFQNSALTGLSNVALAMYQTPPAETSMYLADVGRTLGFAPRVQAQGVGFSGLAPLLELWKAFRNIAYALLAAIMIVVGFMVMFRKKIDPKTVVTVQNAIPRVVVALLLVTFSYAIVGVMIDLMYLAIVLAASVVSNASPALGQAVSLFTTGGTCLPGGVEVGSGTAETSEVTGALFSGGLGRMFAFFMGSGFQAWDDIAAMLTGGFNWKAEASWVLIPGFIGTMIGGKKGAVAGLVSAPVLLTLIILIVLIFGFVRLVFMLVDAYINIIISLLIAPFQLMMEAVPGTNAFATWSKNLLSKVIVFPLTAVLLMVSAILTSQDVSASIWAPPLISTGSGGFGMAGVIGLGMLLIIPGVVAGFQKALKAEPVLPGGVGTILGPVGSGVGQLWNLWYQASFIGSAMRHKPDTRTPFQAAKEGSEKGLGSIIGGGGH